MPNEKKLMTIFLEREASRVADVSARGPARAAAAKEAEEGKKAKVWLTGMAMIFVMYGCTGI